MNLHFQIDYFLTQLQDDSKRNLFGHNFGSPISINFTEQMFWFQVPLRTRGGQFQV